MIQPIGPSFPPSNIPPSQPPLQPSDLDALRDELKQDVINYYAQPPTATLQDIQQLAEKIKNFLSSNEGRIEAAWNKTWKGAAENPEGPNGWETYFSSTNNLIKDLANIPNHLNPDAVIDNLNEQFTQLAYVTFNNK